MNQYPGLAELVDAPDLESGGRPWGFESLSPDQIEKESLFSILNTGFSIISMKKTERRMNSHMVKKTHILWVICISIISR